MKKAIISMAVVGWCVFGLGFAFSASSVPSGGDFTVLGVGEDANFAVGENGMVIVKMPILSDQKTLPRKWTVACSYAVNKDGEWILLAEDNYDIPSKIEGDSVIGGRKFDAEWVWPRCWGHDAGEKTWLWINQAGKFTRKNVNGEISYEALVNTVTGEVLPVPSSYMTRN